MCIILPDENGDILLVCNFLNPFTSELNWWVVSKLKGINVFVCFPLEFVMNKYLWVTVVRVQMGWYWMFTLMHPHFARYIPCCCCHGYCCRGQWSKKSNGSHVAFPREIGSDIERRVNIPVLDLLLELNSICIFFSFIWYAYTKDVAVEQVSAGKTKKSLDMSQCDSTLNLKVSNQWYSFKNCLFNILHICSITFKINKGSSKGCSMYITEWKPYRS